MFKSRALKRHESFNDLIKTFECTSGRVRHSKEKFAIAFEAVCVLCQCKIELEVPLFDVLVEAVIDAIGAQNDFDNLEFNEEEEEGLSSEEEDSAEAEEGDGWI